MPIANGSWDLSPQKKSESESCSVVSNSLQPHRLNSPWKSPGQNTGAGSCSLLQGIFPNPGIEPGSPVLQVDSFPAELPGKPLKGKVAQSWLTLCDPVDYTVHGILQARILEWVVFPFSSGSSWPRNWTGVSCIAGRLFTSWATREAPWPEIIPTPWVVKAQIPNHETNFFLLLVLPIFIPLWLKNIFCIIPILLNLSKVFYGLVCDLCQRVFCVLLRRIYILLSCEVFYRNLLSLVCL